MASIITYWNDVEAGGRTIFPYLNVTVIPEKGAGLFFFNYKQSGRYDEDLHHSGCPLLFGTKQFDLKMFSYFGQKNIQCSTNKDELFNLDI